MGKRQTFRASVVHSTVALYAEPCDKMCFVSSNMMFVICCKFELDKVIAIS